MSQSRSESPESPDQEFDPRASSLSGKVAQDVMDELLAMRSSIDNIDATLVYLLAERFKATQRVGHLKAEHNLPPADPGREVAQIARLRRLAADAHLDPAFAEKFLNFIISEVIRHHQAISETRNGGSNDAGASVASLFQVYRYLSTTEQAYNLIFLASCEEEVSGKNGIESVLPQLPPIALGVVGEPTEMHPAIAEKGLMVLDVTAHGKAGHAARNEGENAIYKALDDIQWFRNYRFPKESSFLGPVKMSVTQVNAGTQHNVVPDICTFVVDIRSNECYSNEELFIQSEAKARSFRLNSSHIDAEHPFVKRAVELGRTPFGSPTLSDQALMRFPSVKIGPGKSSRSHTADEYIRVSEIEEAIGMYIKILDGLVI